jgi:glutaredoxin/glutathione-dependent peroxiredoxin
MTIKVGDKIPEGKFRIITADGPGWATTDEVFKGKTVALFAAPGAYTGVCHKQHMPSIISNVAAMKGKGVDTVAVTTVNDAFVLDTWKKDLKADGVEFLADGNADFAKAVGLSADMSGGGMGTRSQRYSMLVKDGVVKQLNVEDSPGKVEKSNGDVLLGQL